MQTLIIISAVIAVIFKLLMLAFILAFTALVFHCLYQSYVNNDDTMLNKFTK